jgi:putative ATP-binding cassette transporter
MNVLIDFFRTRSSFPPSRLVWMAAVAGISNAFLLYVLNAGAANAVHGDALGWLLFAFVATLSVFIFSQRYLFVTTTMELEKILHAYRMQQVERVRHCDLDALEDIGAAVIFGVLTRQTLIISTAGGPIVLGAQAVVVVAFGLVYLAWLSIAALLVAVMIIGVGAVVYQSRMNLARIGLAEVRAKENELFNSIRDLIDGFKEIRLNVRRSADLSAFIERISRAVLDTSVKVYRKLTELFVFGQIVFFGAAAAIVFLLPGMGFVESEDLLKALTVILFLMGPITAITGASPAIAKARASCEALLDLERQLEAAARRSHATSERLTTFEQIELRGVVYQHKLAGVNGGFEVGPIDLQLRRGELLFISGGNGSGKSTLLKLVTALYVPQMGELVVDGAAVNADRREAYQNLFSTVFSDFHLFDRTFGLGDVSSEQVSEWLARMEIDGKTRLHQGQFDTIRLSTGQRKRLALVVAALEDRPIYVLDEFAADQDPSFRRKFYDELLPALHERGKTVIVVTHDERYFHRATRHLTMEEGRFVEGGASRA